MICNTEVAKANNAFAISRRVQFAGGRRLSCARARAIADRCVRRSEAKNWAIAYLTCLEALRKNRNK